MPLAQKDRRSCEWRRRPGYRCRLKHRRPFSNYRSKVVAVCRSNARALWRARETRPPLLARENHLWKESGSLRRRSPLNVADEFLRSEEHTSELQSHSDLVCRLLLEKKKKKTEITYTK